MFRLNLSTRPFYNERAVHLALGVLAVVLAAITVFNVREVLTLSSRQTALRSAIGADEARAREFRQRAQGLRGQMREDELEAVLAAAREANLLIDRRTFSWSELLNHIEATLPADVMLTAVAPDVGEAGITVTIAVLGRSIGDVDAFIRRLEETGVFSDLLSASEAPDDDGLYRVAISGKYRPAAPAAAAATPAGTAPATGEGR
jgi:Tfp pilus assembly protein PilN